MIRLLIGEILMGAVTLTWTNSTNPSIVFEQKVYRAEAIFVPGAEPEDPEVLDVDNLVWEELEEIEVQGNVGTSPVQYMAIDNTVATVLTTDDKIMVYKVVCEKDALETTSNITQITIPATFGTVDNLNAIYTPG